MKRELHGVHVGFEAPEVWDQQDALAALSAPAGSGGATRHQRPTLSAPDFPWRDLGVEPRFISRESIDCVAALQPNVFHGHGADELDRYLRGAATRGETALLISMIGEDGAQPRYPLASHDASVLLPGMQGSIAGRRLPEGTVGQVPGGLDLTDRDLALRLLNRPAGSAWWAIEPASLEAVRGDGTGRQVYTPSGQFKPVLVNAIGEALASVWLPEEKDWRWYVVPRGDDWPQLVEWLVARALPEHVPGALRRVRTSEPLDEELLTNAELTARAALTQFEGEVDERRAQLVAEVSAARQIATDMRSGLLYGTGRELVLAVKRALEEGGLVVEDLDETLGIGVSADLLVSMTRGYWLVEVKSAGGSPGEDLVDDLQRHVRTWPQLKRPETLSGGALVVNHQHKRSPLERQTEVYRRAEFVASLPFPVVPALALFAWSRDGDFAAIKAAVTGDARQHSHNLQRRSAARNGTASKLGKNRAGPSA
jgi:hypothetical protein